LHLYHNNTDGNGLHVQKIVRAICGSGLTPDASGTKCVKDEPPAPSSGSISVENCYITEIDGTSCVSEEGGEYTVTEVSQGIPILVKQDGVTKVTQWLNAAMGHSYTGTFSPTLKLNPSNFQLTAIGLDNKAIVESTTAQAICGTTSDGITLTANSDNTKCVAGTPPVNEWKIYFDIKPNPLIDGRSAKLTYKIEKTGQGLCTIDSDPKDFSLINLNKWQDPNSKLFVFKVTDDEGEVIIKPRVKTDDDPLNKKTKYTYTGKCTGGYISEPVELDVIKLSEIEN
jgi:hypothetical protein